MTLLPSWMLSSATIFPVLLPNLVLHPPPSQAHPLCTRATRTITDFLFRCGRICDGGVDLPDHVASLHAEEDSGLLPPKLSPQIPEASAAQIQNRLLRVSADLPVWYVVSVETLPFDVVAVVARAYCFSSQTLRRRHMTFGFDMINLSKLTMAQED